VGLCKETFCDEELTIECGLKSYYKANSQCSPPFLFLVVSQSRFSSHPHHSMWGSKSSFVDRTGGGAYNIN
ncbi:hypothetical protein J6590_106898, partial [Homalodisca vitripennis]